MTTASPDPSSPPDTGYAPPKWAFDPEVTRVFDQMLWRSIPGYPIMRALVTALAYRHQRPSGLVVDLGCSRGGAIAALVEQAPKGDLTSYIGVEVSDPMIAAARARFGSNDRVVIRMCDLRADFPPVTPSSVDVVLAVLTLQFIPIEHRARVVRRSYESLRPGGAMLVVEKILGSTSAADEMLVAAYYDHKRASGYSQEEVDRKRLSLEGVLVPQTARANEEMLRAEGFREVERFWQHLNFAGWVAVK